MIRLFALMCLVATGASAGVLDGPKTNKDGTPIGDRPVLIFAEPNAHPAKGKTIAAADAIVILYTDVPCHMPVEGRENMFRSADGLGVGCWAPTLDGGYQIIHEIDGLVHQHPGLSTFQTALFHTYTQRLNIVDMNVNWFMDALASKSKSHY